MDSARALNSAWAVMHSSAMHAAAVHSAAPSSAAAAPHHLRDHALIHVRGKPGRGENLDGLGLWQGETEQRNAKKGPSCQTRQSHDFLPCRCRLSRPLAEAERTARNR
jgi:hypothetical protein